MLKLMKILCICIYSILSTAFNEKDKPNCLKAEVCFFEGNETSRYNGNQVKNGGLEAPTWCIWQQQRF